VLSFFGHGGQSWTVRLNVNFSGLLTLLGERARKMKRRIEGRPILRFSVVCPLIICITAFARPAVAQVKDCQATLSNDTVSKTELTETLEKHSQWLANEIKFQSDDKLSSTASLYRIAFNIQEAVAKGRVEGRAVLCNRNLKNVKLDGKQLSGADLRGSDLTGASLKGATLIHTYFDEACLARTAMMNVDLRTAILDNAKLYGTDLHEAVLSLASLRGTILADAKIEAAKIDYAFLDNAFYSPSSPAPSAYVGNLSGLSTMSYWTPFLVLHLPCDGNVSPLGKPLGLVQLRKLFIDNGDRTQERAVTFAIEHSRTNELLNTLGLSTSPVSGLSQLHKRSDENLLSGVEGILRVVLFEWTSGYGLEPGRPILLLIALIPMFAISYWCAISFGTKSGMTGIYRIWPKDRVGLTRAGLGFLEPKVERVLARPLKGFLYALQFSILSAFQIGWREFNVGAWLSRIQSRDYALSAKGWVRSLSGVQSILSLYLLALSILTYFGRAF